MSSPNPADANTAPTAPSFRDIHGSETVEILAQHKQHKRGCGQKRALMPEQCTSLQQIQPLDLDLEERIMKRRMDIDSLGDDKNIVKLTKSFMTYCSGLQNESLEITDDFSDLEKTRYGMKLQLRQLQFNTKKHHQTLKNLLKESLSYENLSVEVVAEIEKAKTILKSLQNQMEQNSDEKNKLVAVKAASALVKQLQDTTLTNAKLNILKSDLDCLEAFNTELTEVMEKQTQQMGQLRSGVSTLNKLFLRSKEIAKE